MNTQQLPPFTPIGATPVSLDHEAPKAKRVKKDKTNGDASAKVPKKKQAAMLAAAKKAIRARGVNTPPAKRTRSARVAPLMMDAAQALAALNGLGRKEVESMQALVLLLNPLPRPARKRVLEAVAAIMGNK